MAKSSNETKFIQEVVKISKKVQTTLNSQLPRGNGLVYVEHTGKQFFGGEISVYNIENELGGDLWRVQIHAQFTPDEKVKYKIQCKFIDKASIKKGGWKPYAVEDVVVSRNEEYTKNEINSAEKTVIVKVVEEFDKARREF